MRNQNIKQIKRDPEFVDFRNHVTTFLYDLNIMAAMAYDRNDLFEEGCINQLCYFVKSYAVSLFNDVITEDDEYCTAWYTGCARSFREAKEQFLSWLNERYDIRPTYYDGALNSYNTSLEKVKDRIAITEGYKKVLEKNPDFFYPEGDDDEDLPF